jgi:CheY-like chemotaxis protein
MPSEKVSILLVDDDEIDIRAMLGAFRKLNLEDSVTVARNGHAALLALRGADCQSRLRRPCLVLLDLKMPRMGGLQVLEELRKDPEIRDTIVFVFSTSCSESDKRAAFHHNVAAYLVNSTDDEKALDLVSRYLKIAEFPADTGIRLD